MAGLILSLHSFCLGRAGFRLQKDPVWSAIAYIYIYIHLWGRTTWSKFDGISSCKSIEHIFTFCCCTKRIICETFRFVPTLIHILCLCALLASFSANYYVEVLCSVNRFPPWRWQSSELFHEQNKSLCLAVEYQYGGKMLQHRWAKRKYRWVYQNHIYIYVLYVLYRHVRQYHWSACRLLPVCEPLCVEELWHDLVQIQHGSIDIQHITYLQTFGNDDKPQLDYVTHFSQPVRWRRHKEVMINLSIAASSN